MPCPSTCQDSPVITIDRDTYGVPHIYGATEADVAFGFGYAQAQDHLALMLRNYREAAGRLAEVDGDEALETDARTRLWKITAEAGASYLTLNPATRAYIDAFADGVNACMTTHPDRKPSWADPVTPVDLIALYRLLHIRLNEWRMPELKSPLPSGMSNQWAIAPAKTAQGVTLCAMDPHVPWVPFFRMYEAHLVSEDGLNIYGAAPFGLPTIILGHTGRHAWSLTINNCDISDMYIEQLDPQDPGRYRYQDAWLHVETWKETFHIRTADGLRQEERTLSRTHHGPIVATSGDQAFTVRMSASDIRDPVTVLLEMARAHSVDEFKNALDPLDIPMFNIVYGDVEGQIYYVYNQRCPVRSESFDWRQPVPGWRHSTEWQIYYPFRMLPQISNPPAGFLQNCNNAPWYVCPDSPIHPRDYPAYVTFEEQNGRSRRVFDWLSRHDRITVEQTLDLVMDEYCLTADELKPALIAACEALRETGGDPDGLMALAIALLRTWNHIGDARSTGMTVFSLWKMRYDARIEGCETKPTEDEDRRLMVEALQETAQDMIVRYGRLEVPWGDIHRLRRGERTYPVGGSSRCTEAIRPVGGAMDDEGRLIADYGSAFTMVVALGDEIQAWSLIPYGNSEEPDSPHYADQIPLWTEGRLKRTRFTPEEVEANRESIVELIRL